MVRYFNGDNKEILNAKNDKGEVIEVGKQSWSRYWSVIPNTLKGYNRSVIMFKDTIEMKSYAKDKTQQSYKLDEDFKLISSENGKKSQLIHIKSNDVVISRELSDEEFLNQKTKENRNRRKRFIQKALSNNWTHFGTMSFSPEIVPNAAHDYEEAKNIFMAWRKSIARKHSDFRYMAIPEFGSMDNTHRIHWHALLYFNPEIVFEQAKSKNGKPLFLTKMTEEGAYRNVLDSNGKSVPKLILPWQYGISDFYPIYNTPQKAVYYMAKYVTKAIEGSPYEQQGKKAKSYLSSKNLEKPKYECFWDTHPSFLLPLKTQKALESATPTFKLVNGQEEIMRKTEAIIDSAGITHTLRKKASVIDVTKKARQSATPTSPIDEHSSSEN